MLDLLRTRVVRATGCDRELQLTSKMNDDARKKLIFARRGFVFRFSVTLARSLSA